MEREQIVNRLAAVDERFARESDARIALLSELTMLYEQREVVSGSTAFSLHKSCSCAAQCWGTLPAEARPTRSEIHGTGEDGSIFWPWIGADYTGGGVCLLALNLHQGQWWAPWTEEYFVAKHQLDEMAAGKKRIHRSLFAYRSSTSANAILSAAAGAEPLLGPDPRLCAATMNGVARLQLIKCSPQRRRAEPTGAMRDSCPELYAAEEIAILAPGALVLLGNDARRACEQMGEIEWQVPLLRGRLALPELSIELFVVPHPNSRGTTWPNGHLRLVESLRQQPPKLGR